MQIKVKYEKGVFKPLKKISGLKEGEILDVSINDLHAIQMAGGSFDFLYDEEDLYTEDDVIEPV